MSELACGVTLAFTASPFPFPFLSFLELPLGTSAMSFCGRIRGGLVSGVCGATGGVRVAVGGVPCQSRGPSSGQLSSLRWSRTSLGLTARPQWLKHTSVVKRESEVCAAGGIGAVV